MFHPTQKHRLMGIQPTQKTLGTPRITKTWEACSSFEKTAVLQTDTRGSKRLQAPEKKKLANPSNRIYMHKFRETHPQNRSKKLVEFKLG